MGSERVAMMCGGICVRLDAHLPRKLALFLIWYKTPRGGKTAEISKILTFLHGRPPSQSAQSLRPACKRLSLAGGVADCVRTGRREASMGLICRFQGTRGQLWRPSRRAEQCPTHCHLAQTTSVTRVRQALAVSTHGHTSDTRRGRQLQLAAKGDYLDGGLQDRIEREYLGGKDRRWADHTMGRCPAHRDAHLSSPLKMNTLTARYKDEPCGPVVCQQWHQM